MQLLAYQVAREALRNALRHSNASVIKVDVSDREGDLRISVEDDGVGFDPDSINTHVHFGLGLIRERVELVGGVLQIESMRGQGTLIVAKLPSAAPET